MRGLFPRRISGLRPLPASLLLGGGALSAAVKIVYLGLTGDPRYAAKRAARGSPYVYQVEALFEGSQGTGRRLQQRECLVKFDKQ